MKKKLLTIMLSVSMAAGTGAVSMLPVQAAQTTAAADAASQAASQDAVVEANHSGDLLDYLGTDSSTIQKMFLIDRTNATQNSGSQLYSSEGIVFQTNAQGKVEFINMYQASDFSIRGVKIGMDNPTVRAILTGLGWKETILSTSIGDLWTFIGPDGEYSMTVITDANGIVLNVAATQLSN